MQEAKTLAGNLVAAKGCQVAGDSSKPSYTCSQGKQASKSPLIHGCISVQYLVYICRSPPCSSVTPNSYEVLQTVWDAM